MGIYVENSKRIRYKLYIREIRWRDERPSARGRGREVRGEHDGELHAEGDRWAWESD